jgi:hypothetical protein
MRFNCDDYSDPFSPKKAFLGSKNVGTMGEEFFKPPGLCLEVID